MHYVVGSGPAGVACAYALVRKGIQVTLLDAGLQLEPSRQGQVSGLRSVEPDQWRGSGASFLRDGMDATTQGIPLKLAYGSDFPYRPVAGAAEIALDSASVAPSYAQGGFSNVWGSAVLPNRQIDILDWPIDLERLGKHYRSIFEFLPLAARRDDLEEEFPLYTEDCRSLAMSRQAASMLHRMEKHRRALRSKGVRFGGSRIAVHARKDGHDCALCGLCMYGCPYGLIYSSSETLEQLRQFENFRYHPGIHVTRVEENAERVTISGVSVSGNGAQEFTGERVYIACGVAATAALLLRSLDRYDRPVRAADSQYFLLPVLRFGGATGVRKEALHTLAQLFLEIDDPAISQHTIHLQIYTYNDLFEGALRSALGPLAALPPSEALISRLLLAQGYLHSAHSAGIEMKLRRSSATSETLCISAVENPQTKKILRALTGKLLRLSPALGAAPLPFLLRVGAPGRGFHTGGTFPMRETPQELETDIYGRPAGMTRIHAVDSSVLPSVPATTITLTVMANAHRIADELEQYA